MISLWPFVSSTAALIIAHATLLGITAQHTRRRSPLRYLLLALCFVLCAVHVQRLHAKPLNRGWLGECVAAAPLVSLINAIDKFILRGWDFESYQEMAKASLIKQGKNPKTLQLDSKKMVSEINEQPRGVGTFWQVSNVPLFDPSKGPDFVPDRWDYILRQSIRLPLRYVGRIFLCRLHFYLAANKPLPSDGYLAYTGFQIAITWCTWFADGFVLGGLLDLMGLITALTNPSKLWMFRPLFGPLSESYTIRRFWGVTWHQNLRSWLEGWSSFIATDVLRVSKKGVFQRYFKILLSFTISGVLHLFTNMGIGAPFPHWPTLFFFVSQGVGIMIEDFVITAWKRSGVPRQPALERTIGFVWVVVYMGFTKPWWQDTVTAYSSPEDSMLTWNMVKNLFWSES